MGIGCLVAAGVIALLLICNLIGCAVLSVLVGITQINRMEGMGDSEGHNAGFAMLLWLMWVFLSDAGYSYAAEVSNVGTNASRNLSFTIDWPLQVTASKPDEHKLSLLHGELTASLVDLKNGNHVLKIVVWIKRPSSEQQRAFWNSTLAYPQYNWMSAVRVWDEGRQWLWPNLPYLLRPFGTQRIERYGGWDPGKKVDNDFAAVLIRKYDSTGVNESSITTTNPLVSAEWHADGKTNINAHTVVHTAKSDEFLVTLCDRQKPQAGQIRIWIIYADFLGSPVPRGWPKEPEFNGGILKFFKIDWASQAEHGCTFEIKEEVPPGKTRFDWKRWLNRMTEDSEVDAIPRLSD